MLIHDSMRPCAPMQWNNLTANEMLACIAPAQAITLLLMGALPRLSCRACLAAPACLLMGRRPPLPCLLPPTHMACAPCELPQLVNATWQG